MAVSWQKPPESPLAFPKAVKVKTQARLKQTGGPRKKRPGPPRKSERVRDEAYLAEVRERSCCLTTARGTTCGPAVRNDGMRWGTEADHAGPRPLGRKADDNTAIPMCPKHHDERTDGTGFFKGWTKERMRAWCDEQIAATQARILSHGGRRR